MTKQKQTIENKAEMPYDAKIRLEKKVDMKEFFKEFGLSPWWMAEGYVTSSVITARPGTRDYREAWLRFMPGKTDEILIRSRDQKDSKAEVVTDYVSAYLKYKEVNYSVVRN